MKEIMDTDRTKHFRSLSKQIKKSRINVSSCSVKTKFHSHQSNYIIDYSNDLIE